MAVCARCTRDGAGGHLTHVHATEHANAWGVTTQILVRWPRLFGQFFHDNAFALMLPYANTEAMQEFLDQFPATIADDEHVAMMLDQAGWHEANDLVVPDNITLIPLPAYSPELNPVERLRGARPLAPPARRLRGHRQCGLHRLEPARRRGRTHHITVHLSVA